MMLFANISTGSAFIAFAFLVITSTFPHLCLHASALQVHQPFPSGFEYVNQPGKLCPSTRSNPCKRSHKIDISVFPASSPPIVNSGSEGGNTTLADSAEQSYPSSWAPTWETTITAIFRAVITILSLLNINITWRIHGKSDFQI